MYKFLLAITFLFITNSHAESGYDIADKTKLNASYQLVLQAFTDIEIDVEFESDLPTFYVLRNNRPLEFSYISKYSLNNHLPLLNNKLQYLRPRSPPFFII
ncbi:hypothetical protein ND2E_3374 [Colwellia psychrerythraea]|uniref:Uncharacterized protein n=1 Tax=Colwellia psychrerythraea TaxID=28229 RepID=A0A099KL45_COLPS|nr:hypothetical protein ND2E_3374 [Colwellia psychrerythraea]